MTTFTRFVLAVAVLLVPVGAAGLRADDGSIPIFKQTTITAPGRYVVTRDFSFASGNGIAIRANNVTLDLNGHTITGPACTAGENVIAIVTSTATQGIVIQNGRLISACNGISAGNTNRLTVRVERVEVGGASVGIVIDSAEYAEILGCYVHDVAVGIGIDVRAIGTYRGKISDNRVEHIASTGIRVYGMVSGEVRHNVVVDYGSTVPAVPGILLWGDPSPPEAGGNLVEGNTVTASSGADDDGILAESTSPFNIIMKNVVTGCRSGIRSVADGTWIERNVVSRNSSNGIFIGSSSVGSFNHLEENQTQANTGAGACGIKFLNGNGHVFRNNNLRNNTTGVCNGTMGTNTDGGGNIL
jgi:hypothetical protein